MTSVEIYKRLQRSMDLIEYRALQILNAEGSAKVRLYALEILKTINPNQDYGNQQFCENRIAELEETYRDER